MKQTELTATSKEWPTNTEVHLLWEKRPDQPHITEETEIHISTVRTLIRTTDRRGPVVSITMKAIWPLLICSLPLSPFPSYLPLSPLWLCGGLIPASNVTVAFHMATTISAPHLSRTHVLWFFSLDFFLQAFWCVGTVCYGCHPSSNGPSIFKYFPNFINYTLVHLDFSVIRHLKLLDHHCLKSLLPLLSCWATTA